MKLSLKKNCIILVSTILGLTAIVFMIVYRIEHEYIPNQISPSIGLQFDYIIGAGTAGSVVASKLSELSQNSSVLLIEAGNTFGLLSKIPLLAVYLQGSSNDWKFASTPQKHSSGAMYNRQQFFPRGKGLGGTSQINFLVNFDRVKEDLVRWGIPKLSYETLKPYLDTYENSANDIWKVPPKYSSLTKVFVEAKDHFRKFNFRLSEYNVKNGLRYGVFEKYLRNAFNNSNLNFLLNSLVTKLIFDDNSSIKAVTINSPYHGVELKISVKLEVILCAGTFQTPQLLMVSGVGPKQILNRYGVPVVQDLQHVGRNFYEQLNVPLYTSIEGTGSINSKLVFSLAEIRKYLNNGEGVFGNFGVYGHVDSVEHPIGVSFFGVGAIDENSMRDISNYKKHHFRAIFPLYFNSTQEGFVTIANCHQPKSRGRITIKSSRMNDEPLIDPNFLANKEDINCSIKSIRLVAQIINSHPFKKLKPTIHWPKIPECNKFGPLNEPSDRYKPSYKYLKCIIEYIGFASHHPGGTASINRVVSDDFRVYGVNGLRIVDASVLPMPISGNPNTMIIAMAKRLVDVILKR